MRFAKSVRCALLVAALVGVLQVRAAASEAAPESGIALSGVARLTELDLAGLPDAPIEDAAGDDAATTGAGRLHAIARAIRLFAPHPAGAPANPIDASPQTPREFAWTLYPVRVADGVYDLSYPSPRPSGDAINDVVSCRFHRAHGLAADQRAPIALVLHHLGGDFGIEALLAAYLARNGVHALEVEFPYYGKRKRESEDPQKEMMARDVASWIVPMQQCIADIRAAVDWAIQRSDVDGERIGLVGVSLGGIIGALVAGVEPRLTRNVLVIAGGEVADIVLTPSREMREMRATLAERGIEREELRRLLAPIEPLNFAWRIDAASVLMINAKDDAVVPRSCTESLHDAIGDPEIVWLSGDHYSIALHLGTIFELIRDHFQRANAAPAEKAPEDF